MFLSVQSGLLGGCLFQPTDYKTWHSEHGECED